MVAVTRRPLLRVTGLVTLLAASVSLSDTGCDAMLLTQATCDTGIVCGGAGRSCPRFSCTCNDGTMATVHTSCLPEGCCESRDSACNARCVDKGGADAHGIGPFAGGADIYGNDPSALPPPDPDDAGSPDAATVGTGGSSGTGGASGGGGVGGAKGGSAGSSGGAGGSACPTAPGPFLSTKGVARAIAVDTTSVWVEDDAGITRYPKSGTPSVVPMSTGAQSGLATDGQGIYFVTSAGLLARYSVTTQTTQTISSAMVVPTTTTVVAYSGGFVAVAGVSTLYFVSVMGATASTATKGPTALVPFATDAMGVPDFAWLEGTAGAAQLRLGGPSLSAQTVATALDATAIASDGSTLYVSSPTSGAISRVGAMGVVAVVKGEKPVALGVAGSYLYWANTAASGCGAIRRALSAGGAATTVSVAASPKAIAFDATNFVYWTDAQGGVYRSAIGP